MDYQFIASYLIATAEEKIANGIELNNAKVVRLQDLIREFRNNEISKENFSKGYYDEDQIYLLNQIAHWMA